MVPDDLASQERHCGASGALQVSVGGLGRRRVTMFCCIKSTADGDNALEILVDFVILVGLWYLIFCS